MKDLYKCIAEAVCMETLFHKMAIKREVLLIINLCFPLFTVVDSTSDPCEANGVIWPSG
jgi:hypothetical protein